MNPHPLYTLREKLLDHSNPAELLRIADNYLQSMGKMGEAFVLPAEHRLILPALEFYAGDLDGWVKYVKGIRDRLDPSDSRWRDVYELYRNMEIRRVQRIRRDRLVAVVTEAVKQRLIENTVPARQRYANRCTQHWAKARAAVLDAVRSKTKSGKVSEAERSEVLAEFWAAVDDDIKKGELPTP